jgi:3alpha(or 20beta)-hydroxysteroid dehydrogenase
MGKLDGKVAIITGAASGMGAAQARLFVQEGASVVLADIDVTGKQIADELGPGATFSQHDVSLAEDWFRTIALAESAFGAPNILVNTAGIQLDRLLLETSGEDFERIWRTNSLGPFLGMRHVGETMKANGGGVIVNINSIAAIRVLTGASAYCGAKGGLRLVSRIAAKELAQHNIRVNSIFPGPIDTPVITPEVRAMLDQVMAMTPAGRMGTPEEIALATLYLASDDASFMLGSELAIDGGVAL